MYEATMMVLTFFAVLGDLAFRFALIVFAVRFTLWLDKREERLEEPTDYPWD